MRFALLISFFLLSPTAEARPVSYVGGTMLMLSHDGASSALELDYSFTPRHAVGYRHEYFRDESAHLDALQFNWLLKRWNNPNSQANFWLQTGAGAAYDGDNSEAAAYGGLSIDWEDRRFYTMYENKGLWDSDDNVAVDSFIKHKARIGIAPYIGDAGDLHTWVMLQADYEPAAADNFSLTPLVRMFKGSTLGEVGYNLDDQKILLNLTHTF